MSITSELAPSTTFNLLITKSSSLKRSTSRIYKQIKWMTGIRTSKMTVIRWTWMVSAIETTTGLSKVSNLKASLLHTIILEQVQFQFNRNL